RARVRAKRLPRPDEAPVTRATWPVRSMEKFGRGYSMCVMSCSGVGPGRHWRRTHASCLPSHAWSSLMVARIGAWDIVQSDESARHGAALNGGIAVDSCDPSHKEKEHEAGLVRSCGTGKARADR